MTNLLYDLLIDHIDATMAAMAPETSARLTHPNPAQRRSAIAIMAQTLASRIAAERDLPETLDTGMSPLLPIEPRLQQAGAAIGVGDAVPRR